MKNNPKAFTKMKAKIIFIASMLLILNAYAQDRNQLISKSWICEKVIGTGDDFEIFVKEQYDKSSGSKVKSNLEKYSRFIGVLQEHVSRQSAPAKWDFSTDGSLHAVKIYNEYYIDRGDEHLNWKIENDNLIIFGINSDGWEIIIYLKIETLNDKEMILSKSIGDRIIKIYYAILK